MRGHALFSSGKASIIARAGDGERRKIYPDTSNKNPAAERKRIAPFLILVDYHITRLLVKHICV
jgi:hypothetical protein